MPGLVADAYEFIDRADQWPARLPHVSRVVLREDRPGVQRLEMDTVTAAGDTHTTNSVRVCQPMETIVYKQVVPPSLLLGHSGSWTFAQDGDRVRVTARHTVAIDPTAIADRLGPEVTLAQARTQVRDALGGNSRATLTHAGTFTAARQAARQGSGTNRGSGR
jgi:hypothetical protein